MLKPYLPFILLFLLFVPKGGQGQDDLRAKKEYFSSQGEVYQRWLQSSGLGQYLTVYDVRVGENYVAVRLLVPFEQAEAAAGAYHALKDAFEKESVLSLEEQLFYKAHFILDIPREKVHVTIRNNYIQSTPFLRSISFKDGDVVTKADNPKSKITDVDLVVRPLKGDAEPGVAAYHGGYAKEKVFDCVIQFAKERYEQRECFNKEPTVEDVSRGQRLRFKVRGLCREVIPEDNSLVKSLLQTFGLAENWYKRELLYFTITYLPTSDGAQLVIILEGKFGSGLYSSVNEAGYILMESDFNDELQNYTDRFGLELRDFLTNCH